MLGKLARSTFIALPQEIRLLSEEVGVVWDFAAISRFKFEIRTENV